MKIELDLSKLVEIRRWSGYDDSISNEEISLKIIAENPECLNMADVGFYLINELRKELGLEIFPKHCLSGMEELI